MRPRRAKRALQPCSADAASYRLRSGAASLGQLPPDEDPRGLPGQRGCSHLRLRRPADDRVRCRTSSTATRSPSTAPAGSLSATVPMNKTAEREAPTSRRSCSPAAATPRPSRAAPGPTSRSADLSLSPAGGAVCFPDGIPADCVSWGSFTPPVAGLPSPSAPNASPGGISDGKALERSISAGCATLLESGDDTELQRRRLLRGLSRSRARNSTPPSEHACRPPPRPQTTIVSGPKGKTRDRTPTFRFSSSLAGGSFRCKLDRRPFARCSSPKTYGRLGFGPHTFQVKAVKGGRADLSPARRSFKVVRAR